MNAPYGWRCRGALPVKVDGSTGTLLNSKAPRGFTSSMGPRCQGQGHVRDAPGILLGWIVGACLGLLASCRSVWA